MRNASLTVAAALISGTVAAQEEVRRNQQPEELRADWIIGTTVTSPEGETIGTIDDLLTREQAEEAPSFNFRDQELPPPPAPAAGDPGTVPAPTPAQ